MIIIISSAKELSASSKKTLQKSLTEKYNVSDIIFEYKIDASLLGGVLIYDGKDYFDSTVKGQMSQLRKSVLKVDTATIPEKATSKDLVKRFNSAVKKAKIDHSAMPTGVVVASYDGIIKVKGLMHAKYGELLEVDGKFFAIVLSLEEEEIGAIVLDDEDKVRANMLVKTTGEIVEVPVGDELLGRAISPIGEPVDGLGDLGTTKRRPLECHAPDIKERAKVDEPLYTGLLAIDSMIPIGKGQRELIIGDRQTGKTSVALDTIINQRGKNVNCIYVAIGQKASSVSGIMHTLSEYGAMEYTTIVCSTARDSSPLQYIAPFVGCAIAEEWMYQGKDVLIVYDDLSKHAVAYRAMSLLLKRPPGREAFPGDIFYLHSRLLERAAKLSKENGGGSITALPIIETQAGDISAYIPTNVISITDGQIYLESELFNAGIRPAVNVGLSVSRVGSSAQIGPMKRVGGKLRLDLSQYRELEIFAQFGTDLDKQTTAMLEYGKRTMESLKQDVHVPLDVEHQIIILYITQMQLLKNIEVRNVRAFNQGFLNYIDINCPQVLQNIAKNQDLNMEDKLNIEEALKLYQDYFFSQKEEDNK